MRRALTEPGGGEEAHLPHERVDHLERPGIDDLCVVELGERLRLDEVGS